MKKGKISTRRWMAWLLSIVMIMTMLPVNALAEEFPEGTSSSEEVGENPSSSEEGEEQGPENQDTCVEINGYALRNTETGEQIYLEREDRLGLWVSYGGDHEENIAGTYVLSGNMKMMNSMGEEYWVDWVSSDISVTLTQNDCWIVMENVPENETGNDLNVRVINSERREEYAAAAQGQLAPCDMTAVTIYFSGENPHSGNFYWDQIGDEACSYLVWKKWQGRELVTGEGTRRFDGFPGYYMSVLVVNPNEVQVGYGLDWFSPNDEYKQMIFHAANGVDYYEGYSQGKWVTGRQFSMFDGNEVLESVEIEGVYYYPENTVTVSGKGAVRLTSDPAYSDNRLIWPYATPAKLMFDEHKSMLSWQEMRIVETDGEHRNLANPNTEGTWEGIVLLINEEREVTIQSGGELWGLPEGTVWQNWRDIPLERMEEAGVTALRLPRGKFFLGYTFDQNEKIHVYVDSDYTFSLVNSENEYLVLDIRETGAVYLAEGTYSILGWRVIRNENGENTETPFNETITVNESGYYQFETCGLGDGYIDENWNINLRQVSVLTLSTQVSGSIDNGEYSDYVFTVQEDGYYTINVSFISDSGFYRYADSNSMIDHWWTEGFSEVKYFVQGESLTFTVGDSQGMHNEYTLEVTKGHEHQFGWFEEPDGTKVRCQYCQEEAAAIVYSSEHEEEYYSDAVEAIECFAERFSQDCSDVTLELYQSAVVEQDLVIINNDSDRKWRAVNLKNGAILTVEGGIQIDGNITFSVNREVESRGESLIATQGIAARGAEGSSQPELNLNAGVQANLRLEWAYVGFGGNGFHQGTLSMENANGGVNGDFTFYYDPRPYLWIDDRMILIQGTDEYGDYYHYVSRTCDIVDSEGNIAFDNYNMSAGGSIVIETFTLDRFVDNFGITYYATNRYWENGAWVVELTQDESIADRGMVVPAGNTIHFRENNGNYRFIVTPAAMIDEWRNYGQWEMYTWHDHAVGLDIWEDRYFSAEQWFSVSRKGYDPETGEQRSPMALVDEMGNPLEGVILSEGTYRLLPTEGEASHFRMEEGNFDLRIIENEQGEWILSIERRLEWYIDIPGRGRLDKFNPTLSVDQDYTIDQVRVNNNYYFLSNGVVGEMGSILLCDYWTGNVLNFRRTTQFDQPFDQYRFWVEQTREGSCYLYYEKIGMIHLNEMEIPFGNTNSFTLDAGEEMPLNIEYRGISYGIQPVDGRLHPGTYVLEPLGEGSQAVVPVLDPENHSTYIISFNISPEGQFILNIQGGYMYYLVDENQAWVMSLACEDEIYVAEDLPAGTYTVMAEREEAGGQIRSENTGRTVYIAEQGSYGIWLRNGHPEWYGEMEIVVMVPEILNQGENQKQIFDPFRFNLFQYTAQTDEFHTFSIRYRDGMTAIMRMPNMYTVTGFGGERILGGYLHEGETAYIAVRPHQPASRDYSITVVEGCLHDDKDEDGVCDICETTMVAKILKWGDYEPEAKVYTSLEEALTALTESTTQTTTLSLLGNGNTYTVNDELILSGIDGQFQDYIINLNGNTLVIDEGITLDKVQLTINDSEEHVGDVYADVTIISDELINATGERCRGELIIENAALHGTIDFQGSASEEDPDAIIAYLRLEYQGFFYGTLTGEYGEVVMNDGGTIDAIFATVNSDYFFNGGCVLSSLDGLGGTNRFSADLTRFRYNPVDLIEKDWQVSVAENINGSEWYVVTSHCSNAADGLIPGIREICENAVNAGMIPITYAAGNYNTQGTTSFAGSVSLMVNNSVSEFEDLVYSAATATPEWLVGELLMNNIGLNVDSEGQLDLAGGSLTIQYAMSVEAHSVSEETNEFGYTLGAVVTATAVYTDVDGQTTTITSSEKIRTLPDAVVVKACVPSTAAQTPLGLSVIQLDAAGEDLRAFYAAQIEVIEDETYVTFNNLEGMYDFVVTVNTKEIYQIDADGQLKVPADVDFGFIGQQKTFDFSIGEDEAEVVYLIYMENWDIAYFEETEEGKPMLCSTGIGQAGAIIGAFQNDILVGTRRIQVDVEQTVPQMYGYSLTLDGKIGLNYYLTIPENVEEELSDTAYVVLSHNNEVLDIVQLTEARRSGDLYKFTSYVSAKEMHDEVVLHLFDEGEEITVYSKYGDACENGVPFSVAEYRRMAMERGVNGDLMYLMDTMLNYGYAAQMYFDYNTDSAEQIMPIQPFNFDGWQDIRLEDNSWEFAYYGSTLLLKEDTVIRHYFRVNGDPNGYVFSSRYGNLQLQQKGSLYYVDVPGVPATDLSESIIVQGINNQIDQFIGITYGPYSYAYQACKSGSEELKNLMYTMAAYCNASRQYFWFSLNE